MSELDVRGMACPAPVVAVKRAIEAGDTELRVRVDDGAPRENIRRFAQNRGFTVSEEPQEGGFLLCLAGQPAAVAGSFGPGAVLLVGTDRLGDGPEELGRLLMKNFMMTLPELERLPDRIFFLNTGVLLAAAGSEVIEPLARLVERGVEVSSCGICLDYFHKKEALGVGEVTNMLVIAETLLNARSVVRL